MTHSILSTDKRCYFCGSPNVVKHHIFPGKNRKLSDKHGCWVWLCPDHHNMSTHSVHLDSDMDMTLRQICQLRFEEGSTRDEFIRIFGRSYL